MTTLTEKITDYPFLVNDVTQAPTRVFWKRGGYTFHLFSIGERGTELTPQIMIEVLKGLRRRIIPYDSQFDKIVTIEPGGHPWGLLIAHHLRIPLSIIRMRSSQMGGETCMSKMVKYISGIYILVEHFKKDKK
ncbi:MAG: phosphoribosyltransferase [Euryarchaeota archaeon]|nr:phosphoribosyltransferase [Euryarchaeota archaeon]